MKLPTRRSVELGAYLGEKLTALKAKHPSIGDVRGLGLFWAVELVKDQQKKNPFNSWQDKLDGKPMVTDQVAGKMAAKGVVVMSWMSHFVLADDLLNTEADVLQTVP